MGFTEIKGITVHGNLHKCEQCGRKILVEHIMGGLHVVPDCVLVCWDCLARETQEKCRKDFKL